MRCTCTHSGPNRSSPIAGTGGKFLGRCGEAGNQHVQNEKAKQPYTMNGVPGSRGWPGEVRESDNEVGIGTYNPLIRCKVGIYLTQVALALVIHIGCSCGAFHHARQF